MKTCIFCERALTEGARAKEHIIPEWLIKHLELHDGEMNFSHLTWEQQADSFKPVVKSNSSMRPRSFVSGNVCKTCNSGWMSSLEIQAMPILKQLIARDEAVFPLGPNEKEILARWALKTAVSYNYATTYKHKIPRDHARYLVDHRNGMPKSIVSFFGISDHFVPVYVSHRSFWPIVDSEESDHNPESDARDRYKIGLHFGHLMLCVAFWNAKENFRFIVEHDVHYSLWPHNGPLYISASLGEVRPLDARTTYDRFLNTLAVSYVELTDGMIQPPVKGMRLISGDER